MNEQNSVATQDNGVVTTPREKLACKAVFETEAEAEATLPPPKGKIVYRVYLVRQDEVVLGYTGASNVEGAIVVAARSRGFTAGIASKKGHVGMSIEERIALLSDAELKALGLKRAKAPKIEVAV